MGIIKRQAFQSSILLYVGTLLGFLTTGILAPNLLTEGEIGTLRLLMSYSAIFMSVSIFGFSTVTIRFVPQFFDKLKNTYNGFLGISILIGTVGFIVSLILIYAVKPTIIQNNLDKSPQFAHFFFLIIPLTLFQTYYTLFDSYNNALYRSSFGIFLRDFVQRVLVLIGLLLVFIHFIDFGIYIYIYVAAICLPTLLILLHLVWHKSLDLKINYKKLTKPLMTSMLSVGVFGLFNSFSNLAVLQIDTIMVNMYIDSTAVGIYAITFFFGTLVFIPAKALNKIAPTLISKAYKENDLETVKDIYYKSCGNLFLIGVLILLGLLVNLDNVFNIIPRSYEEGKYVIVFIGFANLVKMAGGTNDSVINYSKYYKITTLFMIILGVLVIGLNFIFIPKYGMSGAAFASLLSLLIYNLIKMFFIRSKYALNPYNLQYIYIMGLAGMIYLIVFYLPISANFVIEIIIDSTITTILFYFSVKYFPIAKDLDKTAIEIYRKAMGVFR